MGEGIDEDPKKARESRITGAIAAAAACTRNYTRQACWPYGAETCDSRLDWLAFVVMTVPLTGCGKSITPEDVAGTYTSDKDPKKYEISITAGGACDLTSNENGNIRLGYSVKLNGSSLQVEPPTGRPRCIRCRRGGSAT